MAPELSPTAGWHLVSVTSSPARVLHSGGHLLETTPTQDEQACGRKQQRGRRFGNRCDEYLGVAIGVDARAHDGDAVIGNPGGIEETCQTAAPSETTELRLQLRDGQSSG